MEKSQNQFTNRNQCTTTIDSSCNNIFNFRNFQNLHIGVKLDFININSFVGDKLKEKNFKLENLKKNKLVGRNS